MKCIMHFLIIFSFFNLYSAEGIDSNTLWKATRSATNVRPLDSTTIQSPCWFVNKNAQYPFQQTDFTKLVPKFSPQPDTNISYAMGAYAFLPAVACIVGLGFNVPITPMLPFVASNALSIIAHTHYLQNRFKQIIKNLTNEDGYLTSNEKIKTYLTGIQQFPGKFDSICKCGKDIKTLVKEPNDNSSSMATEQDYRFIPIKVPEHIKNNILKKTALTKKDYFYSALMTAFFVSCISALFYKSLTAHLNMQTFSTMGIIILFNWLFLYAENKKQQDHLLKNFHIMYEGFVINVHNNQFLVSSTDKLMKYSAAPIVDNIADYTDTLD